MSISGWMSDCFASYLYHFVISTRSWRAASGCAAAKSAGERMALLHQRLQTLAQHVGVDLRGRDVGVAQHLLQRAQVGAVVQQMAGEGVAQHVRRHLGGVDAGLARQILQERSEEHTSELQSLMRS